MGSSAATPGCPRHRRPIEAWNIGLRTEGGHGEARVDEECYDDIARALRSSIVERNEVPVITGYVGHDADGRVTTLGRGGSDLTATTLARAGASETQEPLFAEVQVWKDVDGLMSADPKVVSNSVNVPFATYEEAAELAYFGASILHPPLSDRPRSASARSYREPQPGPSRYAHCVAVEDR